MDKELNINIPKSWDEIKLKTYQKLQKYYKSLEDKDKIDLIKVVSILSDTSEDDINLLPSKYIDRIFESLSFLNKTPEYEPSNKIIIDNEEYIVNPMEEMKVGEYVDMNIAIDRDQDDFATILAIICRKKGELYDQKYINNEYENRIKIFENTYLSNILPVINFFLSLLKISIYLSPQSMNQLKENLNQYVQHIETSQRNGNTNQQFTFSQKKTLRKLKKLIKEI